MIDLTELKRALSWHPELVVPSYSSGKHQMLAVLVEAALDAQEPEKTAAIAALRRAIESQKFQDQLQFHGRPPHVSPMPPRLAGFLDSPNPQLRFLGASFIRVLWMPEATPGLLRGLCDEDSQVREACLSALRGRRGKKLDPASLRELLTSERADVHHVALRLLASLQAPPHFSREPCPLQEELQRVSSAPAAPGPVRACAAALWDGSPELPGLWEAALDAVRTESDEDIRAHAMGRLGRLHQQRVERMAELIQAVSATLKKNPESDWWPAIAALRGLVPTSDAAIEALIDAFRFIPGRQGGNSPEQEVISALYTSREKPERVIPRLLDALENPEFVGSARAGAVRALAWFRVEGRIPQEAISAFMKALRDPSGHVVEEAASALKKGDKETLVPLLLQMLKDATLQGIGRCGVALVLGHFGERAAIPHLAYLLEQDDSMFPMHELSHAPPGSCIAHPVDVPLMKRDAADSLIPFGRLALEALPALLENLIAQPGPLQGGVACALSAMQPTHDEVEAAFPRMREKILLRRSRHRELDEGERERIDHHLRALIKEALNPREHRTRGGW